MPLMNYKQKNFTNSCDTKPCDNLMKYAERADILLHEVFIKGELKCPICRRNDTPNVDDCMSVWAY